MSDTPGSDATAALPYRPCVGLMVLNGDGLIFAGQRIDSSLDAWQMPQGGIDPGEAPQEAALRELREETGIKPERVTVLRESAHWLAYDLPDYLIGKLWGGRYRGQTQRWFALRFDGADDEVDIESGDREFRAWSWMAPDDLLANIVPFKRDTYGAVLSEFSDLLRR
ncbi:MAG: RNA pyrophosphohydrolase [Pseudomonadota bacterium]